MPKAEAFTVGEPLPRIEAVSPGDGVRVRVTWAGDGGRTETVDLAPALFKYKAYAPLRNDSGLFGSVRVTGDGFALAWGEGGIDMASATVEALAGQSWGAADFARFLDRNGIAPDALAAELGLDPRQAAAYRDGAPIPRSVALACGGLEEAERDENKRLLAAQKAILRDLADRFAADDPADGIVDYLAGRAGKS